MTPWPVRRTPGVRMDVGIPGIGGRILQGSQVLSVMAGGAVLVSVFLFVGSATAIATSNLLAGLSGLFLATLLFVAGTWILTGKGQASVWRRLLHRRDPNGPRWNWEIGWRAEGEMRRLPERQLTSDRFSAACMITVGLLYLGVILPSPGGYVAAILLAGAASIFVYRFFCVMTWGWSTVHYATIPFDKREPVRVTFEVGPSGSDIEDAAYVLRCISEVHKAGKYQSVVLHAVAAEPDPTRPPPGPNAEVALEFLLPSDAPGTHVDPKQAVYWELEITGRSRSGRYAERFLLPIYEIDPAWGLAASGHGTAG